MHNGHNSRVTPSPVWAAPAPGPGYSQWNGSAFVLQQDVKAPQPYLNISQTQPRQPQPQHVASSNSFHVSQSFPSQHTYQLGANNSNISNTHMQNGGSHLSLPGWCFQPQILPGIYQQVLMYAHNSGSLDTGRLYNVLMSSQLDKSVLARLWGVANTGAAGLGVGAGVLSPPECVSLLVLVALAQTNRLLLSGLNSASAVCRVLQQLPPPNHPSFPVPHLALPQPLPLYHPQVAPAPAPAPVPAPAPPISSSNFNQSIGHRPNSHSSAYNSQMDGPQPQPQSQSEILNEEDAICTVYIAEEDLSYSDSYSHSSSSNSACESPQHLPRQVTGPAPTARNTPQYSNHAHQQSQFVPPVPQQTQLPFSMGQLHPSVPSYANAPSTNLTNITQVPTVSQEQSSPDTSFSDFTDFSGFESALPVPAPAPAPVPASSVSLPLPSTSLSFLSSPANTPHNHQQVPNTPTLSNLPPQGNRPSGEVADKYSVFKELENLSNSVSPAKDETVQIKQTPDMESFTIAPENDHCQFTSIPNSQSFTFAELISAKETNILSHDNDSANGIGTKDSSEGGDDWAKFEGVTDSLGASKTTVLQNTASVDNTSNQANLSNSNWGDFEAQAQSRTKPTPAIVNNFATDNPNEDKPVFSAFPSSESKDVCSADDASQQNENADWADFGAAPDVEGAEKQDPQKEETDEWANFETSSASAPARGEENEELKTVDVSSLVWNKAQISTDGFYDRIKQTILSESTKTKTFDMPGLGSNITVSDLSDVEATPGLEAESSSIEKQVDEQYDSGAIHTAPTPQKDLSESTSYNLGTPKRALRPTRPANPPLADKYSNIENINKGDSLPARNGSVQVEEWLKCLEQCLQCLEAGNLALEECSSQGVRQEVLDSRRWAEFCDSAILVFNVALRLNKSFTNAKLFDSQFSELFSRVQLVWTQLIQCFPSELKESEVMFKISSEDLPGLAEVGSEACGVCLLQVSQTHAHTSASSNQENNEEACLSFGGRLYHPTCANLWVNRVTLVLPALPVIDVL